MTFHHETDREVLTSAIHAALDDCYDLLLGFTAGLLGVGALVTLYGLTL